VPAGPSVSIVVPAFNEERRITATLESLCAYLRGTSWDWDVRVVDDGSADDTRRLVAALAAEEPRVVIQAEPHRGKGGAVKAGLLAARGAYRFMCDADLSMPVEQLSRFLSAVSSGADVVIATREGRDAARVGEPAHRHLIGRGFNFAVQRLLLPGINDSQCGFKMFSAAAVAAIFPKGSLDGWAFDLEVLAIARAEGLHIVEVPVEWHYRPDSHVRIARDAAGMFRDLLTVRRRARGGFGSISGDGRPQVSTRR